MIQLNKLERPVGHALLLLAVFFIGTNIQAKVLDWSTWTDSSIKQYDRYISYLTQAKLDEHKAFRTLRKMAAKIEKQFKDAKATGVDKAFKAMEGTKTAGYLYGHTYDTLATIWDAINKTGYELIPTKNPGTNVTFYALSQTFSGNKNGTAAYYQQIAKDKKITKAMLACIKKYDKNYLEEKAILKQVLDYNKKKKPSYTVYKDLDTLKKVCEEQKKRLVAVKEAQKNIDKFIAVFQAEAPNPFDKQQALKALAESLPKALEAITTYYQALPNKKRFDRDLDETIKSFSTVPQGADEKKAFEYGIKLTFYQDIKTCCATPANTLKDTIKKLADPLNTTFLARALTSAPLKAQLQKNFFNAVTQGQLEGVKDALKMNFDINIPNEYGNPALYQAIIYKHTDIAKLLINEGANLTIKNKFGLNALMLAASHGQKDIVTLLINKKVNLNERDNDGNTALNLAIIVNDTDIAKLLIDASADTTIKNNNNQTAYDLATGEIKEMFKPKADIEPKTEQPPAPTSTIDQDAHKLVVDFASALKTIMDSAQS